MNDGEWLNLADDGGETVAVVCILGRSGDRTLLSEQGERFVAAGPDEFVHAASGKRFVRHVTRNAPMRAATPYQVEFEPAAGHVRLRIDGDFSQSSSVDRTWEDAFDRLGEGQEIARVLIVRGPGRMANDLVKLQQLQRFSDRGHAVERIAAVLPPGDGVRCATFVTVATLRGLRVQVFEDEATAAAWLLS